MKSHFDAFIVNSIVDGALNFFSTKYNMNLTTDKPFLKSMNMNLLEKEFYVGCSTVFRGKEFRGEISLIFPEMIYKEILLNDANNLSCDEKELLKNGSIEILRGICAEVYEDLTDRGYYPTPAKYSRFAGLPLHLKRLSKRPALIIPFHSDSESFYMELSENL